MKKNIKILITAIFSAVIISAVYIYESSNAEYSVVRKLCDGFFISSVLLFLYGGFGFAIEHGAFDAVTFGFKKVMHRAKNETYFDYIQKRESKEKKSYAVEICACCLEFIVALILAL